MNRESPWTLFWLTFSLSALSFFLVCSLPPSSSLQLCFTVCLLAFLCDSAWPFGNPFPSQLALVEQLKSLLHTRLHLPSSPSLPLCLSFCCSPSLFSLPDSYMPYTPCTFHSDSLSSASPFLACGSSPSLPLLCFWTMSLLCPCLPMSAWNIDVPLSNEDSGWRIENRKKNRYFIILLLDHKKERRPE